MPRDYKITIRGITGWDAKKQGTAHERCGGFVIQWDAEGIGFGELTVSMDASGIVLHTETMSEEFCRAVWDALLRDGTFT